ncbi:hypothetical protein TrST_g4218 [Triparma strigata]|uniref:Uncharacterized protein n=1 Tax=Triparma strigata TaxID=1606541 RepID=A0A9W7DRX6_9STRA|nr:hypothetical protein TrST_g4218 [Triparma strigata]
MGGPKVLPAPSPHEYSQGGQNESSVNGDTASQFSCDTTELHPPGSASVYSVAGGEIADVETNSKDENESSNITERGRRNSTIEMLESATAIETLLNVVGKGKIRKNDKVRILVSSFEPRIIDSKDTVGAHFLGPQAAVVMWGLLKGPSALAANILFLICCIIVCGCHWLPNSYSYLTILSLLYLLPNISSMNTYISKRVLKSFDFWLYSGYLTATIATIITMLRDARIVAFSVGWILGIYLLFCDALPDKVRIRTLRFGVPLFAIAMLSSCVGLYFDLFRELVEWHLTFGKTKYSSTIIAMNCGGNFLLFNSKAIFHAIRNPHRFSLIGAKLKSIKGNARHVGAFKHFDNLLGKGVGSPEKGKRKLYDDNISGKDIYSEG